MDRSSIWAFDAVSEGAPLHKLLLFMKRRPGLSLDEFRAYYEIRHVPLCLGYMGLGAKRYFRRYLEPQPGRGEPEFDVITELWFDSRAAVDAVIETMARDAMPADVIKDEKKLFDRTKTRAFAVSEAETRLGG